MSTVLGPTLRLEGSIRADDPLLVLGRVNGRIECTSSLEIGLSAVVEAALAGREVRVQGTVLGDVDARDRAELGPSAKLAGNVRAARIHIADGARFAGQLDIAEGGRR
jgi:cytoskeletal protein CcmA (bactofilin family)